MNEIKILLKKDYNLDDLTIKKLYGYDNLNFFVETKNKKYVLKLYDSNSVSKDLLFAENDILIFLSNKEKDLFPYPIKSKFGKYIDEFEFNNKKTIFRLISYLEGDMLVDIESSKLLFESFGTKVATMNKHLMSYKNAIYEAHSTVWDVSNTLMSKKYLKHIKDTENREITEYFMNLFEKQALHILPSLRKSIIHNDANDRNVLVQKGKVSGIFDFGDLVYSALINEIAICLAYGLEFRDNLLHWTSIFLSAYHKIFALKTEEVDILYYLIPARLCISVCNSSFSIIHKPDNEYIIINQKPAYRLLKEWRKIEPEHAKKIFRTAINIAK